jgi:hypothetical protein
MQRFHYEGQVTAGGEDLTLVCDFGAIMALEGSLGEDWDDIVPKLVKPSTTLSTQVLWSLLRRKHVGITLDEAASFVHGPDAKAVGDCCWDVINRALDHGRANEGDDAKKKLDGASPTSGSDG